MNLNGATPRSSRVPIKLEKVTCIPQSFASWEGFFMHWPSGPSMNCIYKAFYSKLLPEYHKELATSSFKVYHAQLLDMLSY